MSRFNWISWQGICQLSWVDCWSIVLPRPSLCSQQDKCWWWKHKAFSHVRSLWHCFFLGLERHINWPDLIFGPEDVLAATTSLVLHTVAARRRQSIVIYLWNYHRQNGLGSSAQGVAWNRTTALVSHLDNSFTNRIDKEYSVLRVNINYK